MRKKYFSGSVLALLSLSATVAQAQTNFRPGYVVRLAGDTVRGEVNYRDARASATECQFRATPGAPPTTFKPTELRAYGLREEARLYQALALPDTTAAATAGQGTVYFAEVLLTGPASLYSKRDNERTDHYYVVVEGAPAIELVQRIVRVMTPKGVALQEINTYRNTLAQVLRDCPAAQAQLPALLFKPRSLKQVLTAYNTCRQPQAQAVAVPGQRPRQRPRVGLVVGVDMTASHMQYTGAGSRPYDLTLARATSLAGGLTFSLPLPRFSRRLALEIELLYGSQQYGRVFDDEYGTSVNTYSIKMSHLRVPVLLRYTMPKGKLRPFVEAGPALGYAVALDARITRNPYYGPAGREYPLFPENVRRFQESLVGSIGVQTSYWHGRQASLRVRYEADTGWTSGINTSSSHVYGLLAVDLSK